jgi:DNA-cytosine methyltransferase
MNVLSLFDGKSCGQIALDRVGIKVDNYFACEIDKFAMKITNKNYPSTIQLGSVTDLHGVDILLPKIDLLIGGSPCQGFSFAGKQLNFEDPRSKLFFEFVRILEEVRQVNPDVLFMLENVRMKKEYQDIISKYLGVQPIMINSALVSAQNRRRLYWTNIPNITQPEDKGILLRDIIHEQVDELIEVEQFNINPSGKGMNGLVYCVAKDKSNTLTTNKGEGQKVSVGVSETPVIIEAGPETDSHIKWFKKNADERLKKKYSALDPEKAITMTARQYANWNGNFIMEELAKYIVPFDKTLQILDKEVERGKVGYFRKDNQANRVYFIHGNNVVLRVPEATKQGYVDINPNPNPNEGVDLTFPNSKTRRGRRMEDKSNCLTAAGHKMGIFGCITPDRVEKRQNGQRFNEGKKFYTLTAQDRHGILIEGYIRKLTPIECERLQTVPDHYTEGVSNSQRYKMLGNGWTIDVIAHIFKNIKV